MDKWLSWIPTALSSKTSIIIGIAMFAYLVVLGAVGILIGHPSLVPDNAQLVLGNYCNVASMVAAGIAAGAGHKAVQNQRRAHEMHQQTHELLTQISEQLDVPDAE
ncbi:hypothetical protein EF294_03415 [Gordonia oryzae]|uniref:Uncharacterized protein n=1 Tax=Gordonia oryzae TaxID=2487349 RepID=A0A3N4GY81_9ACTN|nr:hypothetical protein [Gordonia oryzae]RPA65798.1 hypothetical protein EF294_03415 [Gordonia oryzae]